MERQDGANAVIIQPSISGKHAADVAIKYRPHAVSGTVATGSQTKNIHGTQLRNGGLLVIGGNHCDEDACTGWHGDHRDFGTSSSRSIHSPWAVVR